MNIRLFAIILLAGALSACKNLDGVYLPGCPAYAGDRIELNGGSFTWDKFTDQVSVDAAGERIDPFPDYPREGSYTLDGAELNVLMADGGSDATFYLHHDNGRVLLLTEVQQAEWETSGRHDECALTRSNEE